MSESVEKTRLRTFVALPLPEDVMDKVMEVSTRLQKGCAFNASRPVWAKRESMHITLAFFGSAPSSEVTKITQGIKACAERFQPQRIELKQLDVFPNWHRPRVLWMGIRDRTHQLPELHAAVERALGRFGYEPSEHAFKAHLTLARIKSLKDVHALQNIVQQHPRFVIGPFSIDMMHYYQSEPDEGGHQHTLLESCPFTAPVKTRELDE